MESTRMLMLSTMESTWMLMLSTMESTVLPPLLVHSSQVTVNQMNTCNNAESWSGL